MNPNNEEVIRITFGLKLRQLRNEKGLSLFGLAKKTGLSKSYLNEIEKGKKYPKHDKILLLADALDATFDELVSSRLKGNLAPVADILNSGILKEIPLDFFGIEEQTAIDILAQAPAKFSAFLSTIFEISRMHNITRESFYLTALRAYQEAHLNYFPDLEEAAEQAAHRYGLDPEGKLTSKDLEEVLIEEFQYIIDYEQLETLGDLAGVRSVFTSGKRPKLYIGKNVSETQRTFILAKELAYATLKVNQRPKTFTWIHFSSFEEALNNFRASYFAGALMIPRKPLSQDLEKWLMKEKWDPSSLMKILKKYSDSAETFLQRMTNILPGSFELEDLFFLRFENRSGSPHFHLTKEMHLDRYHEPHGTMGHEHYCRRWISLEVLQDPTGYFNQEDLSLAAQVSHFENNNEQYLVLAAANRDPFRENRSRSVCIGIAINKKSSRKVGFLKDPAIEKREVGVTCERCGISDCQVRAAQPVLLERTEREKRILEKVNGLS